MPSRNSASGVVCDWPAASAVSSFWVAAVRRSNPMVRCPRLDWKRRAAIRTKMNFRLPLWCVSICCLLALSARTISFARTVLDQPNAEMAAGVVAFEKGAFENAITHWQKAAWLYEAAKNDGGRIDAAIHLAAAHQSLGQT